jgi:hypothetical protein
LLWSGQPLLAAQPLATSSLQHLARIGQSLTTCLISATRARTSNGTTRSSTSCQATEQLLAEFQQLANRNGNLHCSSRVLDLHNDLLLISLHGGTSQLANQAFTNVDLLQKACYHMDMAH